MSASNEEVLLNVIYLLLAVVFVVIPIVNFVFKVWDSDYIKASTYSNAYALALTGLWSYDYSLKFPLPSVRDNLILDHNSLTLDKYGIKRYVILPYDAELNNFYKLTGGEFIFAKNIFEQRKIHVARFDINSICIDSNSDSLLSFLKRFYVGKSIRFNQKDCDIFLFFDNSSNQIKFSLSNFYNVEIARAFNELLYEEKLVPKRVEGFGLVIGVKGIDFFTIKKALDEIFKEFINDNGEFLIEAPIYVSCDNPKLSFNITFNGIEDVNNIGGSINILGEFSFVKNSDEKKVLKCFSEELEENSCNPFETKSITIEFNSDTVSGFKKEVDDSKIKINLQLDTLFNKKNFMKYYIKVHLKPLRKRESGNDVEKVFKFIVYSSCINKLIITNNADLMLKALKSKEQLNGILNAMGSFYVLDITNKDFVSACKEEAKKDYCDDLSDLWYNRYFDYLSTKKEKDSKFYNLYYSKYLAQFISEAQKYFFGNYLFFYNRPYLFKIVNPELRTFIYPKKFCKDNQKECGDEIKNWILKINQYSVSKTK